MTDVTLRPSLLGAALTHCIAAQQPVFVWGAPGIGKSQVVRQTCDSLGMECIDVRAVLLDPVDLRGLPTVADGFSVWAVPGWLPKEGCAPTVVFVDELNRAPALVQNAFFQLILDRKLGEYRLPDNCAVVGAGNRESDGGGVTKMSSALANRFVHLHAEPDLDDWCRWAVTGGIEPMVVAFLRFQPQLLHKFDREARAFPSPRSWEFVSRIAKQAPPKDLERALVSGAVGEGAAIEYMAFVELYRALPSIDSILLNPKAAPVPDDMGTLYAVSAAMGAKAKVDNFGRVIEYLDRLPKEFGVFAIRDATTRDPALTATHDFTKWAIHNADLL